uniref:CSON002500 protein n=1 Tax=Culicoides sonorensis TaxID=179676 RepID=A0A336LAC3_CULSO
MIIVYPKLGGKDEHDDEHSEEHEYHDKSESYEKKKKHHHHHHHKKKKHHHHHKKDKSESYEHDEHDSYEYRTISKRDVNASLENAKVIKTNIHVTSEFAAPSIQSTTAPTVVNGTSIQSRKPERSDDKSEESVETSSYEDDYPTFSMGFDEDDYDSRDVSASLTREDSEYSDEYSPKHSKKKQGSYEYLKKPGSYENSKDVVKKKKKYYEDDYEDEPEGIFDMILGSVSRFFSSFMPGGYAKAPKIRKRYDSYEDYSDEDPTARSTTPRIEYRRPKRPKASLMEERRPKDPWYYPSYLFSSSENNEVVVLPTPSPLTSMTTTEKSTWFSNLNPLGIFSIFSSKDDVTTTPRPIESSDENMFDWMPSFMTTTTVSPPISPVQETIQINLPKPLQDPSTWVGILQALQNASQSTTTTESYIMQPPPKIYDEPQVKSYANNQVWRVLPRTQEHVNSLSDHKKGEYGEKLIWLKGPSLRGPTDVIVDPENLESFKEFLDDEGIPFDITIWNLEKAIKYENPPVRYNMMSTEHPLTWYHYHRYGDILKFMEYLQRNFPKHVELIPIGSSFEGMPLVIVKIFSNEADNSFAAYSKTVYQRKNDKKSHYKRKKSKKRVSKPAVFIEAGAHAREWIGPASATWILNHLIDLIHKNNTLNDTIFSVDWYIMPVLNPDGYEYSHNYDRMWRKTRTKIEKKDSLLTAAMNWLQTDDDDPQQIEALKKYCYGTDLNRNWDDSWGVVGASQDPCNDYYAGSAPFSEPESKALSKFLMEHHKKIKIYVSLHSYGQLIAYPPSPSFAYVHERYDDLFDMAMVSLEKLRSSGSPTKYLIDTSSDMIYHRSGSSDSYAMHQIGIPYAFTVELRGTNGPILPANQIEMAAAEAFHLIQGMVEYI